MIESIETFIYPFSPYLAFGLYWVPVILCGIHYTLESIKDYKTDLDNRSNEYYKPNLTIGKILICILITFIPVVNLFKFIFDICPDLLDDFTKMVYKFFNTPLVPAKKK